MIVSYCSGKTGDHTAATVAADCTDPTQTDSGRVANGNRPQERQLARPLRPRPGHYETGQLFPAIAQDSVGNLYATWSEYPAAKNGGTPIGPGSIKMSVSRDGAAHWSAPITVSPANLKNNVMPWITSGSNGRVGIAWYGSTMGHNDKGQWGPDPVDKATWDVYYAVTTNATSKHPTFGVTKVSDHPVKYGDISTGGLGGSQDRSLGDYMQVQMGLHGEALITYVDDTSANRNADTCGGCGETPAEAAGPVMVVTQNGGPSLHRRQEGPDLRPADRLGARQARRRVPRRGRQDVKAPAALDVIGAAVKKKDSKQPHHHADHQRPAPVQRPDHGAAARRAGQHLDGAVGGPVVQGCRVTATSSTSACRRRTAAPSFYVGSTQAITTTHTKYFTYPAAKAINGQDPGRDDLLDRAAVGDRQPAQGPGHVQHHGVLLDAGDAGGAVDPDRSQPGR